MSSYLSSHIRAENNSETTRSASFFPPIQRTDRPESESEIIGHFPTRSDNPGLSPPALNRDWRASANPVRPTRGTVGVNGPQALDETRQSRSDTLLSTATERNSPQVNTEISPRDEQKPKLLRPHPTSIDLSKIHHGGAAKQKEYPHVTVPAQRFVREMQVRRSGGDSVLFLWQCRTFADATPDPWTLQPDAESNGGDTRKRYYLRAAAECEAAAAVAAAAQNQALHACAGPVGGVAPGLARLLDANAAPAIAAMQAGVAWTHVDLVVQTLCESIARACSETAGAGDGCPSGNGTNGSAAAPVREGPSGERRRRGADAAASETGATTSAVAGDVNGSTAPHAGLAFARRRQRRRLGHQPFSDEMLDNAYFEELFLSDRWPEL
ncbi:hypothetical protein HDU83_005679 [Entophlyctis luteolus]|nr:hypothetical protein HDU83_005679 [Entophlyctis luteolus]